MTFTASSLLRCNPAAVRRLGRSLGIDCDSLSDEAVAKVVAKAANRDSLEGYRERAREERAQRAEFAAGEQWSRLMQDMSQ